MKTNEEIRFLPLNASDPIVVIVGGMLILTLVLDPKYWVTVVFSLSRIKY